MEHITKRSVAALMALLLCFTATLTFAETSYASTASTAKHAAKAYKAYLAKHKSVKYFKVVKMGNGGVPVLLCSKYGPVQTGEGKGFIDVDVCVYKKSAASKVKKIGRLSTGGSTYALRYKKGKVYGHRMADIHTTCVAKVKKGKLVLSGMYDNSYAPNLAFRHFSGYKPTAGVALSESKALGAKGTQKQYRALAKKCNEAPKLKLYVNKKSNRAKRIK